MSGTDAVVLASIVIPVTITVVLAWFVLRGKKDDPDERRWRRLEQQRRDAQR